jgi:hypothetical protein
LLLSFLLLCFSASLPAFLLLKPIQFLRYTI